MKMFSRSSQLFLNEYLRYSGSLDNPLYQPGFSWDHNYCCGCCCCHCYRNAIYTSTNSRCFENSRGSLENLNLRSRCYVKRYTENNGEKKRKTTKIKNKNKSIYTRNINKSFNLKVLRYFNTKAVYDDMVCALIRQEVNSDDNDDDEDDDEDIDTKNDDDDKHDDDKRHHIKLSGNDEDDDDDCGNDDDDDFERPRDDVESLLAFVHHLRNENRILKRQQKRHMKKLSLMESEKDDIKIEKNLRDESALRRSEKLIECDVNKGLMEGWKLIKEMQTLRQKYEEEKRERMKTAEKLNRLKMRIHKRLFLKRMEEEEMNEKAQKNELKVVNFQDSIPQGNSSDDTDVVTTSYHNKSQKMKQDCFLNNRQNKVSSKESIKTEEKTDIHLNLDQSFNSKDGTTNVYNSNNSSNNSNNSSNNFINNSEINDYRRDLEQNASYFNYDSHDYNNYYNTTNNDDYNEFNLPKLIPRKGPPQVPNCF